MAELSALVIKRKVIKTNVTRIKNLLSCEMSHAELECRLSLIEAYFKQLLAIQSDIEALNDKDNARAEIEELCILAKAKAIELLGDDFNRSRGELALHIPSRSSNNLPKLKLPKFTGKYAEYQNFISSFKQLVNEDKSLSNIEKFNHLIQCLEGQALDTIRSFQVTTENYEKALNRLKERYDNKTLIFMEHIIDLYSLPDVHKASSITLRSLVDSASAIFSSLKSLGDDKDICDGMLIHLLLNKSDSETQRQWKEKLDLSVLPTWIEFSQHLERRCQFLESVSPDTIENTKQKQKGYVTLQNNRSSFHTRIRDKNCVSCKSGDHWLSGCKRFNEMDVSRRFDTVKKLGICINCLSEGHIVAKCPSKHSCKICNKLHHTLLHRSDICRQNMMPSTSNRVESASINAHIKTVAHKVILATAIILVRDSVGAFKVGRALLDSCSQVNLMTESFVNMLNLQKKKTSVEVVGVGCMSSKLKYETQTTIRSRFNDSEFDLNFLISNRLSGYQPDSALDIRSWQLPSKINLADEHFHNSQSIDMLIGADCFFEMLRSGQLRLGRNLPMLQETVLGWIVSGRYNSSKHVINKSYHITKVDTDIESINKNLEYLWLLQDTASIRKKWNEEEQLCEDAFVKTTTTLPDGRIEVQLPFKESPLLLGDSYNVALKRFHSLERRLSHNCDLKYQYTNFMKEYEQLNHMTEVQNVNLKQPHYFIPHHYVLKPSSTTTKLRVVFDASSSTTSQKSLNDILLTGPTIQSELYLHVMRFRLKRFALSGDITKMYRMIRIHPDCRSYQQILWRETEDNPIRVFQLNTVTYGLSASPFLAIRSLQYIAEKWETEYPVGSHVLKNHFYVDDMLTGADDFHELQITQYEVTSILKKAGIEIAKIQSNHPSFITNNNELKDLNLHEPAITSTLGIKWDSNQDQFLFSYNPSKTYTSLTKRSILSISSSIFDPMGLIAPIIIKSRVLLQDLWIMKIDWDTVVPQQIGIKFENFINDLNNLKSIKIPRYVLQTDIINMQLHGFCDASIRAYGCCFYVRVCNQQGHISVNLLTARSRVAPVKKRTLPQLELCGALILAQLYSKIAPIFSNIHFQTFLWTDSTVVLHWLQHHSSTLTTFVGNRISEVQELTATCSWRHVPTSMNPADVISRGCSTSELLKSNWLSGPAFLNREYEEWPDSCISNTQCKREVDGAIRKIVMICETPTNQVLQFIDRTSSYLKVLRVIGWLLRVRNRVKQRGPDHQHSFTSDELRHSLHCIIWIIQSEHFSNEIHCINNNVEIKTSLKTLSPFIQEVDGFPLLRVGGRLMHASISEERKHPFLLPRHCHFVETLARHHHIENYHAGSKAFNFNFTTTILDRQCQRIN
ncbi:uncharacterized protein LOC119687322 [Teleopsis dalmanni]|uniref:uncharacterized protein LOC119687322 n=1 Tax=Teleopsis dalmanni TaxID=139649 RepID=UPI0018CF5CDF|nr:uncharacterized protein LOC119687322 [Teleopsis dalmanni]